MNRPLIFILSCLLSLFTSLFFFVPFAKADKTYTNPVLVETIHKSVEQSGKKRVNPFSGVLGIGDPSVLLHNSTYYLYPTGDNRGYDVYTSSDMVNWEKGPRVFHTDKRGAWAPDVFYDEKNKTFYLYYTVNRSIGVAVSDSPEGPFTDHGVLIHGAIDAHMFKDDSGEYYLYYVTFPAFRIYVQPMASLTIKQGKPVQLISPTENWEKRHTPLTEAPWMLKHKGTYYLIYSASGANTMEYAIGYAIAGSPVGPFTKYADNPILKKGDGIFGPGHASVTRDQEGTLWMVYHQQKGSTPGWNRIICIDPIWFDDNGILHGKATRGTPQPAPSTDVTLSVYSR